jgi:deferrochelatase/peroxidase EfeB
MKNGLPSARPRIVSTTLLGNCRRSSGTISVVYVELGHVRPGPERGHEHFGFLDGISQPGIRGLTRASRLQAPDQGLPGQDLIWPGEFVYGYPLQNSTDVTAPGPIAEPPATWARNGSFAVIRRLEQLVPEFRAFIAGEAKRLAIYPELLGARMVGRWQSGAPLELAP